jgi:hypothetical protein
LEKHPGRFFSGFHKRFSSLNDISIRDLQTGKGDPIDYHCIVHEAKLPRLHWYRWPNSRSRLVSNGCHWTDHFLFLNDFAPVRSWHAWEAKSGDQVAIAELDNGATFSIALTDHGSSRIGVEDYVELRSGNVTVRIQNGSKYSSETSRKTLRKTKVNRTSSYAEMYREISRKIVSGQPGDTHESVRRSCRLTLDLEESLSRRRDAIGVPKTLSIPNPVT